ncbi:2-dehydro-3-deoxygluconokinase [Pseudomonas amygdali pv. dendropanacis]|uniref:2-dehydro-3-deoxygluconokinase n=1 Tax=Pseudomonas amygdali pv. dendropanacis TaxID=235272 RepID=A0A0P9RJJ5_PSEA0|nr:sugar kinase [Pseudomonas amygdali]KPX11987.1 2-dehydro-3-deoxygluconokinase [Pseudomonas amygdali pv. dendropanacis]KWS80086.1 ketodeoxygluconokinase [Pseudomonas amygdali pv. dendropanacis]
MSLPRVALIGECMIELQQHADGSLRQSFGGDTLNTAVYLARLLGERAKVDYVTALGDDSFSDAMCRIWADEGIGLGKVQRLPGRLPGLYCIQTDANGERRFVRVAFDNNYRPRLWASVEQAREAYQACLQHVDLALLTEDDEQALYGYADSEQLLAAYRGRGIDEIVVKRGAQSCLVEAGGERFDIASQKVERVVDTTAAGDSFSAAYLAARLMGEHPRQAAEAGHRLASVVIQHPGALVPKSVMPV